MDVLSPRQLPVALRLGRLIVDTEAVAAAVLDNAQDHGEPFPAAIQAFYLSRLEAAARAIRSIPTTTGSTMYAPYEPEDADHEDDIDPEDLLQELDEVDGRWDRHPSLSAAERNPSLSRRR